jgi:hypothetical protein
MGFLPSRASPSERSRCVSSTPATLLPLLARTRRRFCREASPIAGARAQCAAGVTRIGSAKGAGPLDFRAWLLAGVRHATAGVNQRRRSMLSWGFCLFRASHVTRTGDGGHGARTLVRPPAPSSSHGLLRRGLATVTRTAASPPRRALRSLARSSVDLGLSPGVGPPEVLKPRLATQKLGASLGSWLCVHLGAGVTSPCPLALLFGPSAAPAGAP